MDHWTDELIVLNLHRLVFCVCNAIAAHIPIEAVRSFDVQINIPSILNIYIFQKKKKFQDTHITLYVPYRTQKFLVMLINTFGN